MASLVGSVGFPLVLHLLIIRLKRYKYFIFAEGSILPGLIISLNIWRIVRIHPVNVLSLFLINSFVLLPDFNARPFVLSQQVTYLQAMATSAKAPSVVLRVCSQKFSHLFF